MTDKSKQSVRIGCSSGFWGDTETAAAQLVSSGDIDYLVADYLAEITMSIMAGQKAKNPQAGYATDFVTSIIPPLLADLKKKNIKVISNAGGVNPLDCRTALVQAAKSQGIDFKVAVVLGDNILSSERDLTEFNLLEIDTGEALPDKLMSFNAYLGVSGIVAALEGGADIVITGRVVDSALILAPLIYEFGWSMTDYDKLAQGSLAGHIIECGAHCTGGNFTDWQAVADGYFNMGFPIAEIYPNADFIITKPVQTGGLVAKATVAEQLVYEIGDPSAYLLPDVICDFTQVKLEQLEEDHVKVTGATGLPPTNFYKVSATYLDGFKCIATFLLGGIEAAGKGQVVADHIIKKTSLMFAAKGFSDYSSVNIELLGTEATYGAHAGNMNTREVVVKIGVTHQDKRALVVFSREIAQAATGMAPGITGIVGGRPQVMPKIRLFSCLIPKQVIDVVVDIGDLQQAVSIEVSEHNQDLPVLKPNPQASQPESNGTEQLYESRVPLIKLAWARSGDKGNHANIGVIAREASYLPYIRNALTESAVAEYLKHLLDSETGRVIRYELPGIQALNFLLENSLGGGGIASLRMDPQGKAFAQQLLDFEIGVPESLANELMSSGKQLPDSYNS